MKVLDSKGKIKKIRVALDTQSNVSFAKKHLGVPREWDSDESRLITGVGGHSSQGTPLTTRVIKGTQVIRLKTRTPPGNLFTGKHSPDMLLSAQHCNELKIDMNTVFT